MRKQVARHQIRIESRPAFGWNRLLFARQTSLREFARLVPAKRPCGSTVFGSFSQVLWPDVAVFFRGVPYCVPQDKWPVESMSELFSRD